MLTLTDKTSILAELLEFYNDGQLDTFKDFVKFNDIALPLAHLIAHGIVKDITPLGEDYIEETFQLLIDILEVTTDDLINTRDLQGLFDVVEYLHGE
jgi:hypothetical protein